MSHSPSAAQVVEQPFAGHAGDVHAQVWERPDAERVVVLVHGYGEHVGRYEHVAAFLGERGAAVWGLDHAGHGRSAGERALIADFDAVVEDVHALVTRARETHPGLPVVMIGHSMGGLIAARYAERHSGELAGLVLSAPLVGELPPLGQLLPMDPIPEMPLDPGTLSRDPAVGQAYADDPLVWHGAFQRGTLAAIVVSLLEIALDSDSIAIPVLWQHGSDDELIPLEGARRGVELMRNATVESHVYPGALHEIFNETNQDEVLADTARFIERVAAG